MHAFVANVAAMLLSQLPPGNIWPGWQNFSIQHALDIIRSGQDNSVVFKRIGHALLMIALIATIGGHWAVLQTVAWTNMLSENLRSESFTAAVQKTFDGKHPCCLCKAINAGKKSEKKNDLPPQLKQLEFINEKPKFIFSAPQDFYLAGCTEDALSGFVHQPSVPPPRSFLA